MPQPTGGDPVNVIMATSGCSTRASPTVPPPPVTTLSQPGGQPHPSMTRGARAVGLWGGAGARGGVAGGVGEGGGGGGEGGRPLVGDQVEGEVERADGADHADRQPQGEAELALAGGRGVERHHVAGQRAGLGGAEAERVDGP